MPASGRRYDTFTRGWLYADLVFCAVRSVLALLLLQGLFLQPDLADGVILLVASGLTGLGLGACGLVGNVLLLRGREAGSVSAWFGVGFTVANILVGVASYPDQIALAEEAGSSRGEAIAVAGLVTLLRCLLLYFYIVALRRAVAVLRAGR